MAKVNLKLTKEENDILSSYKRGEWKISPRSNTLIKEANSATVELSKKDARISIKISTLDLDLIKQKAVREGLPYQSLTK